MTSNRPDALNITEAKYLEGEFGPPEETDVFHRGTPAPGERSHIAPAAVRSSSDNHRVPRSPSGTTLPPSVAQQLALPDVPVWMIAAGTVVGMSVLLVGGLVIWLSMPRQLSVPVRADTTASAEEGKWEGLDVKKGLR